MGKKKSDLENVVDFPSEAAVPVVDLRGTPLGAEIDRVLDASRVEGEAMRAKYGSPEVIDEGVEGVEYRDELSEKIEAIVGEVDEDLAETIERVEEEIDARIEGFELERKVSRYEGYFGAALSGVVAYFGADGDQHGVLVEMAHEIAVKALETADGRRLDVLARIESWGLIEEV